jgi:hypothetical protein
VVLLSGNWIWAFTLHTGLIPPHHDWSGPLLGFKVPTTPSSIHQKASILATTPCIPPLPNFESHNSWGMLQWT